LNVNCIFILWF